MTIITYFIKEVITITVSVHPDKLKDIGQPAYDESMKHHAIKSNQNKFQHNTIIYTHII